MAWPIEHLDRIDSTNTEAMRRIGEGDISPRWLVAREQTAGKGRSGRAWTSAPGNFYGSLILPLDVDRAVASQISLMAGLAVVEALEARAGGAVPGLRLKWPNDVLIGQGKLAGILTESTTTAGLLILVLGIGINLSNPPSDLGRPVAGFVAPDGANDPAALVAPLSHSLDRLLALWQGGARFADIRTLWMARAGARGEAIRVNAGDGPRDGTYEGLDDDGALLMRTMDGHVRRITFGDVMLGNDR